jgi:hypothetical protein
MSCFTFMVCHSIIAQPPTHPPLDSIAHQQQHQQKQCVRNLKDGKETHAEQTFEKS